jgi:hypothetical protein
MNGMFAILALIIGFLLLANPDHVERSTEAVRAQAATHEAARRHAATKRRAALADVLPTPTFEAARWRAWLDSLEHD